MINYEKFELNNGLKILVHTDKTSPFTALNLIYNVGARDENPDMTGFAHLFEHLMFGGSINIPEYDKPLQLVGGENNAFTNNDFTNYYISVPRENIETAFWLESDRMLSLTFTEKSLEAQRSVVIEEFKQRYLNQPYGDVWLLLRPLAYKAHPYRWATIGKEISHIESAKLDDVKNFFFKHYAPNNAILSVVGNVEPEEIRALAQKWFGPIERRDVPQKNIAQEPVQTEPRFEKVTRDVPFDAIYKTYHIFDRTHKHYYTTDLISDILSSGKSSRMYRTLVQEKKLFTSIDASISGTLDNGLFIISGNLIDGVTFEQAENAIAEEIEKISLTLVTDYEFEKVKNKVESAFVFSEINNLNKAMNLGYFELIGDANMINTEIENYRNVTKEDLLNVSKEIFTANNCSTLHYCAKRELITN